MIGQTPNKSLQVTFSPPPIFAAAKTAVTSNSHRGLFSQSSGSVLGSKEYGSKE